MNAAAHEPAYRIDGHPVARADFYGAACDPRRSVVVEACAGAGKTWMLVSRVLRALLDGVLPQQILAITFTRKAAGEMRSRLAEWLAWLAAPETSDAERTEFLCARGLAPERALQLAGAAATLHERVLAGGRPVRIHTFHGWFSQLMRAAPIELLAGLGLQPGMEFVEDTSELEAELFQRFHTALLGDAALQSDYAALVHQRGRSQVRNWLRAAWDKRVEIELADAAGTLENSVCAADLAGLEHPAQALHSAPWRLVLRELALALGRGGARAQDAATALVLALESADAQATYEAAWRALFTGKGAPRKQLGTAELLGTVQAQLEALARQVQAHEASVEHRRMVRLSRLLLAEYARLKRARGVADMADLERCALELLRDAPLSAWVQERLDVQLRQVLIDEFQDTSALQWQALHGWLSAYAGAGGGARVPSVFVVGDPKQSIYRFRRAEPRVFGAVRAFVAQALDGAVLECDHTRRNAPAIVAALNGVFTHAQEEGATSGFRAHTTQVAPTPAALVAALPGVARLLRVASTGGARGWRDSLTTPRREPEELLRRQEADRVALAIHELVAQQGVRPGEIMVLSRKRAALRLLADALQALHLPYAAAEESALLEAAVVRDLVALVDVLASTQHDLSLAHALRSALFGASDADLNTIATLAARAGTRWWPALADAAESELSPALQRARRLLAAWHEAAQQLPPHDLLDRVVHEGELHARVAARVPPQQRAPALQAIDALLAQSLALDGGRYATPYAFVRALRRRNLKAAPVVHADAVQLLTVHGAKGLEARIVFVMDADPQPQASESATLLVDWPVEAPAPRCCAFVASEARCPAAVAPLLERERAARAREELNGLYVAMTRAQERLVFSCTEPTWRAPEPSWWQRVQAVVQPWDPASAPAADAAAVSAVGAAIGAAASLRVLPGWSPPPAPEAPVPGADTVQTRLGRAVHRVLEWSATVPAGLPEGGAMRAAEEFGLEASWAPEIARLAGAVLASPACAAFFDAAALHWAGNEVNVGDAEGALRIDRLVARDTPSGREWWVLDYKLAHAPQSDARNRAQLLRYRAAVRALQPGDTVRAAFITGGGELVEIE